MLNTFGPFPFCLFSAENNTSPSTGVNTHEDSTKVAYDC